MLAESRRRRKNPMHSINLAAPNHWTNDESKFGQKMLEKMGWTKGSGLGKNNQGIAENIRVQHKVTPTGLGFVAHNADDWFKAGEDYARLLSQLAENYDSQLVTESKVKNKKSLVENSLNSRSRVHYHKFTRGKDLTKYKHEELACILGKNKKEEDESNVLNMKEYFKIKRQSKNLNKNEENKNKTGEITDEKLSECDNNNGQKKKKQKHKITHEPSGDSYLDEIQKTPSFNKKRKLEQNTTSDDKTEVSDEINLEVYKKSKLKKKKTEKKPMKVELPVNKNCIENEYNNSEENKNVSIVNLDKNTEVGLKKKKSSKSKCKNEIHLKLENNTEFSATNSLEIISDTNSIKIEESIINNNSDKYSSKEITNELSKFNLTNKYQTLVDSIIENSSAGKKFCKNTPPEFYEKIEQFIDQVKKEPGTTDAYIAIEEKVESTGEKLSKEGELKNLNPDDKNFINDFEDQKSKLLKKKLIIQQTPKLVSDKAMFVAKYSDLLFFGSNINEIKGYGEF